MQHRSPSPTIGHNMTRLWLVCSTGGGTKGCLTFQCLEPLDEGHSCGGRPGLSAAGQACPLGTPQSPIPKWRDPAAAGNGKERAGCQVVRWRWVRSSLCRTFARSLTSIPWSGERAGRGQGEERRGCQRPRTTASGPHRRQAVPPAPPPVQRNRKGVVWGHIEQQFFGIWSSGYHNGGAGPPQPRANILSMLTMQNTVPATCKEPWALHRQKRGGGDRSPSV